jgi:hypothetical protein
MRLAERFEHESALGEPWMWDAQAGLVDRFLAVEQEVEVDRPRAPALLRGAVSAQATFDLQEALEELARRKVCLELGDGVQELRLVGDAHRICLPHRRATDRTELYEQLERPADVLVPVAEVRADAHVRNHPKGP